MKDWDDQFGYELVPAEVKLAFAKPDPNLKRRVDVAINTAAAEQRVRMAMVNRSLGGRGSLGGTVRGSGQSSRTSLPTLSAAALDRAGRANGFGQLRDSLPDFRSGNHRGQAPSANGGSPYGQGPQIGSVTGNGYATSGSDFNDSGAAARRMAEQMQAAANEMRSEGKAAGSLGSPADAMNPAAELSSPMGNHYADLAAPGNASQAADRLKAGRPEDGPSTRDADGSESNGSESGNLPNEPLAGDASGDSVAEPIARQRGPARRRTCLPRPLGDYGCKQSREFSSSGAPSGSSSPSGAQPSQAMQQLQNTQGAQQMQGSPTMTGSPVMMDQDMANDPRMSPPPTMDFNMQPPSGVTADLVRRQGRDWALPASVAGMHGNAIVRTIRMECYPDRFVLLSAKNQGATEVFAFFNGDVDRATLELATALRNRIEQWGPALPGGRWQPRLEVQITPHSEMRFHQLRTLMNGSGIELLGRESP